MKLNPLKFEIYKKDNCCNANFKKNGPGYQIKCSFMNEYREMEILFEDHKYFTETIGLSTGDILGKLFRQLPNINEIDDDFIKVFGESINNAFIDAIEKINTLVKNNQ